MPHLSPPPEPPPEPRSAAPRFECELRSTGPAVTWIRARGELDYASAGRFEQALQAAFSSALVIVDLRQLTFIDCTSLELMIKADAWARGSRRRLVFVHGPEPIDRVFDLVGLSDRLEFIDLKPVLVSDAAGR